MAFGLLVTLAAALRVVSTPGEIIQGDLGYPFASEFWTRPYISAWDTSYGSGLYNVIRTYTYVPWGYVVQAFGLSTEVAGKFHWLSWHLLGFVAGYVGARLLLGPEIRAAHPVAVRIGLVMAGLFWALNPWTLARWEQLGVHLSSVMLPLVIGLVCVPRLALTIPGPGRLVLWPRRQPLHSPSRPHRTTWRSAYFSPSGGLSTPL